MKNLNFDKTRKYSNDQLDEIQKKAQSMIDEINNYKKNQNNEQLKLIPNLENKYIKWNDDGDLCYMYVTWQTLDKWSDDFMLQGVYFSVCESDYRDCSYFSYDPMHNCFINYEVLIEQYNKGVYQEISKEEYETMLKKATDYVLTDIKHYITK